MEDNTTRTATDKREGNNGGAMKIRDNGDGRQGRRKGQRRKSTVTEMRDNRYGCGGRGDTGQQQKRCGTIEMAK